MDPQNTLISTINFKNLMELSSSVLHLSLSQIREKYIDYPVYFIDYTEKDIHEKSLEISFDKEKIIFSCFFDKKDNCNCAMLNFDNEYISNGFIEYFTENQDYCFIKSRFILNDCFVKIREVKENFCFVFYR